MGDYRLSTGVNVTKWGYQNTATGRLAEFDYSTRLNGFTSAGASIQGTVAVTTNSFVGDLASSAFVMSTDLETSNGVEISGLNAEEQSDIALIANWKAGQVTGGTITAGTTTIPGGRPSSLEVYSYYDAMIVLRENNVLELIQ